MSITSDWHIHTHCSCDSASLTFDRLVSDAAELGITDFGVSDHYHTRVQEGDIAASRREFDAAMEKNPHLKGKFHFGIEATVVSAWEVDKIARGDYIETEDIPCYGIRAGGPPNAPLVFDFDEEFMNRYGIEYVVAGMHWPMYCSTDTDSLVKEYHRQYMFAATHPFTTVLAHYLWWDECLLPNIWHVYDVKNPFLDFSVVPMSMKDELKAALIEHDTAFELNISVLFPKSNGLPMSFIDEYLGWAAELQRNGVKIAIGGDCHKQTLKELNYEKANKAFEHYGFDINSFFRL